MNEEEKEKLLIQAARSAAGLLADPRGRIHATDLGKRFPVVDTTENYRYISLVRDCIYLTVMFLYVSMHWPATSLHFSASSESR